MSFNKLYWWKIEKNFGDYASFYLVSHLAEKQIKWAFPQTCVYKDFLNLLRSVKHRKAFRLSSYVGYVYPWDKALFAIGSILDFANRKTVVWGSGFREFDSKYKEAKVLAVRGKLSLEKIPFNKRDKIVLGDPGLLLPLVYDKPQKQKFDVVIIPHFVDYSYFKEKWGDKYVIVNVSTNDLESVIDVIRQSKCVLSSSLHGLIFAHAYGVPALWIKHGYVNSSDFKYYDYFSGVGIPAYEGEFNDESLLSSLDSIVNYFRHMHNCSLINKERLSQIQQNLIRVFPLKLKDKYKEMF